MPAAGLLMRCDQCSMSLPGGCTKLGVCGKDEDLNSLQEALIYGLKGISAYYYHAREMGYEDREVADFLAEALYMTLTNVNFDKKRFIEAILEAGRIHLKTMALLDKAYVEKLGVPRVTKVPLGTDEGRGILVTGHSYRALWELLRQIREMGLEEEIRVYTHSEMLPAHSYPVLASYKSLYGNWGGSWVAQRVEFARFPGVIIGTSNCVLQPPRSYADRMFTVSVAGLEGVRHLPGYDFTEAINMALKTPRMKRVDAGHVTTGFHHLNLLDKLDILAELVREGRIRHIFVIGGCDVPNPKMSYYAQLARMAPKDTIILTAACGKFRYNRFDYGEVEGIPRFMDFGQCNNVYSILVAAYELLRRLDVKPDRLPISIVLSWMEQKAVAILYTLLYLGFRRIYLGPKLPEFLTPRITETLAKQYDIRLVGDPRTDLERMLREGTALREDSPLLTGEAAKLLAVQPPT